MTDRLRTKLAATVTALFLAGVSAAGIATHTSAVPAPTTVVTQTAPASAGPSQVSALMAPPNHEHD